MSNTTVDRSRRLVVPPREGLYRTSPFVLRAADGSGGGDGDGDGDGWTLDGYAAVFNRETVIDSWEGRFKEKLSPGSMKKSFRETRPRIQFDHGRHPLVGSIPVATPRDGFPREETDDELAPEGGAHVVGDLLRNWLVEPVRDAIAARVIDGMSFRFSVMREVWFDQDGKQIRDEQTLLDLLRRTWMEDVPDEELLLRDLREVKVPELGPVVWPAYTDTSVDVRSVVDLSKLDDPEQRKTLARAVFIADAAERMVADQSPQVTEDREVPADEHDEPAADAPQATEADAPAGEHPSTEEQDTKVTTVRYSASALGSADWFLPRPERADRSI